MSYQLHSTLEFPLQGHALCSSQRCNRFGPTYCTENFPVLLQISKYATLELSYTENTFPMLTAVSESGNTLNQHWEGTYGSLNANTFGVELSHCFSMYIWDQNIHSCALQSSMWQYAILWPVQSLLKKNNPQYLHRKWVGVQLTEHRNSNITLWTDNRCMWT